MGACIMIWVIAKVKDRYEAKKMMIIKEREWESGLDIQRRRRKWRDKDRE